MGGSSCLAEVKLALELALHLYIYAEALRIRMIVSLTGLQVAMRTCESPIIRAQRVKHAEMLQLAYKEVQELELESISGVRSPYLWGIREFDEFVYIQTAHVKL